MLAEVVEPDDWDAPLRLRYAGTFDLLAMMAGQDWLLDVKTGKGVYPEVACQLAAYRAAEFALTAGPVPFDYGHARMAALHLRPDGTYALIEVDDADGGALAASPLRPPCPASWPRASGACRGAGDRMATAPARREPIRPEGVPQTYSCRREPLSRAERWKQ